MQGIKSTTSSPKVLNDRVNLQATDGALQKPQDGGCHERQKEHEKKKS
jgi:hypothetical protein